MKALKTLFLALAAVLLFTVANIGDEYSITNKSALELFTYDQIIKMCGLQMPPEDQIEYTPVNIEELRALNLPSSFDWRTQNIMTSIKHQGTCGSCWAFSACGVFEALIKQHLGTTVDLSEQQLIDCIAGHGCNGGWPPEAFKYMKNSGSTVEAYYPYKAADGTCNPNVKHIYYLTQYWNPSLTGKSLADRKLMYKNAIYNYGPVSTGYDIYNDFLNYTSGVYIYNGTAAYSGQGHAIVILGWKDDASIKNGGYWICKNSWGSSWGESGYFRIGYAQCKIDEMLLAYGQYSGSPTNNPPVWSSTIGTLQGREGQSIGFTAAATDVDGDTLSYDVANLPTGATMDQSTGVFSWTPSYTQGGTYNLIVRVIDGKVTTPVTQTVTLEIANVKKITK